MTARAASGRLRPTAAAAPDTRPAPPRAGWGARVVALVAGAPLALAFPAPALWWLALVGLVPVLLLARAAPNAREAAVRAWLSGTGFFLAVNAFLVPKVGPFMVPLAMLLAALWLPLGWLAWRLLGAGPPARPLRLGAALVLLPSAFVAGEAVRSWQGLGGPWGLLGASQWNAPPLLGVAAVGGVWAVSLLLVAVNVGAATAAAGGGDGAGGAGPARDRPPGRAALPGQRAPQPRPRRRPARRRRRPGRVGRDHRRPADLLRVGVSRPGQEPGRRRCRPGGGADRRHDLPAELGPAAARQPGGGAGGGG